jgi:coiled-coil domain-containing protein 6
VGDLAAAVDKLNRDKVALEATLEAEEECLVNRLSRQLEAMAGAYRTLEARLEARGISLKDLGLTGAEMLPPGE